MYHFAEKAQNAFFYCESYADSMARADDASVVYCDPPYAPLSATANFTAYHTNSFTLEQQAHLAEIAEGLVDRHIPVLISNHDTMLTREWYQRAKLHVVKVRRSISSNGGTRKKVDELLALYKPGVVSPAKKIILKEKRMKQYLIAPSILSADFARLGEDTAKPWQLALMSCILTSWITTMFPI